MRTSKEKIEEQLQNSLFELVPFNVAVIDRDFNVVTANDNFEEYFGSWNGCKCFQAYKGTNTNCSNCQSLLTFQDGRVRVSDETGVDRHGRSCHYVVHIAPIKNDKGEVTHVIEMSTDVTETRRWRREYDLLFERAACYISVIDKDYRIIRANEKMRDTFGEVKGHFCYQAFKRRKSPCKDCPAKLTFQDGKDHISSQTGVAKDGSPAHYMVNTSPLSRSKDGVNHIIEIATDITEVHDLQTELRSTHDMYESLVKNSDTGVIALDNNCIVQILNPVACEMIGWKSKKMPDLEWVKKCLPDRVLEQCNYPKDQIPPFETHIRYRGDSEEKIPVILHAVMLKSGRKKLGSAIFIQDLRDIKKLEKDKLDAERLAAVGQTVAGLAHTIKNLLMGLEGGMYMVDSGLKRADAGRISEGWDILQRNFEKTTTLVKDFLSFSKGRVPVVKMINPIDLCQEIVDLYHDTARQQGAMLRIDDKSSCKAAPLDPDGIEACLTNLVSNGLDAALLNENSESEVVISVFDNNNELIFEVHDNGCGMDQKIKQRVFTTFFTTKGGKGTGLGLLTTRKIVQEHGGRLEMETELNTGSIFRIRLPRERLEQLLADQENKEDFSQGDRDVN